jgi:ATP-dependent RNA helicase RhlE
MAIHGNKSQTARTKALADFKKGELTVLVATDIAARGIDIDQLPHVVNFEMPNVPEDYVHRIGRTGRAGASGEAVVAGLRRRERLRARHRAADQARDPEGDRARLRAAGHERPEPIVLGRMVIGEGASRGGHRHHANARSNGGGSAGRGGSGGAAHRNAGHANHGGAGPRHENGARPAPAGQPAHGTPRSAAHGTSRPPTRDAHGQPPRPQGPRPEGRHEGRPPARLVQPKR